MARTTKDCIKAIQQATADLGYGPEITDAQADSLLARIDRLAKERMKSKGTALDHELQAIAGELISEANLEAKVQHRNRLITLDRERRSFAYIKNYVQNTGRSAGEGLLTLLEGGSRLSDGIRQSVDAQASALRDQYLGKLVAGLESSGAMGTFRKFRKVDEEALYKELFNISQADAKPVGFTGNKEAGEIAKIVYEITEAQRIRLNEAGAYIRPLEGRIAFQSHNGSRIRKLGANRQESFDAWYEKILPLLDAERTFQGRDPKAMLREVHRNFYTDSHLKPPDEAEVELFSIQGGSLSNRVSHGRVLHFKSGEAAKAYNDAFGVMNLRDNIMHEIQRNARTIALMENFGPSPKVTYDRIVRRATEWAKNIEENGSVPDQAKNAYKQVQSLNSTALETSWAKVTGDIDIPQNVNLHKGLNYIKAWTRISKLGGAGISSIFTDPVFASVRLARAGFSQFEFMQNIAKVAASRAGADAELRAQVALQGEFLEGFTGTIAHRMDSMTGADGVLQKTQEKFFALTGLTYITNTLKSAVARTVTADLGRVATFDLDAIPSQSLRNTLRNYGVTKEEWEALRTIVSKAPETDHPHILPQDVAKVSDDRLRAILKADGRQDIPANMTRARNRLETKVRTMISDMTDSAVPTPGAAEFRIVSGTNRAGTVSRGIRELLLMFKSFPITILTKHMAQMAYSQGSNTFKEFLLHDGKGRLLLLQMAALATVGGYLSGAVRDALRGRTPKPLTDEDGKPRFDTISDAMLRGGAFGIYGDLLFSDYSRYYSSFTGTALGPVFGQADEAFRIYGELQAGEDPTYKALRLARGNVPFANLFFVRPALDYLFWWHLQEALEPGSLGRMERAVEEQGQEYFISPREAAQ